MNKPKLSWHLLKYEIVNIISNIFVLIFGVAFPLGMTLLFANVFETPDKVAFATDWFIRMAMIIPLASVFMGHATNYAGELECGAIQRFKLFGYKEKTIVSAKLIAMLIFITMSLAIYSLVVGLVLNLSVPSIPALITFIIFFYLYSAILFLIAHAIATFCGRFGTTFGIIMALYFGIMILGGNMGINPSELPNGLRHIAMALPMYYISSDFLDFWNGGSFEWLGFLLSTSGLAIVSVGLVALSWYLTKKGKIKQGVKPVYYD